MQIDYINRLYQYLKSYTQEGEAVWDCDAVDGLSFEDVYIYARCEKYVFIPANGNWCLKVITNPLNPETFEPIIFQKARERGLGRYFCISTDMFTVFMPELGECNAYLQEYYDGGTTEIIDYAACDDKEGRFEEFAPKELLNFLAEYNLHDFHSDNWFWSGDHVKLLDYST